MTSYEMAARHKKVAELVAVLRRAGVTADEAEQSNESSRSLAAVAAGVNPPSEKTWELVVKSLRDTL